MSYTCYVMNWWFMSIVKHVTVIHTRAPLYPLYRCTITMQGQPEEWLLVNGNVAKSRITRSHLRFRLQGRCGRWSSSRVVTGREERQRRQTAGWLMREAPVTGCPLSDNTPLTTILTIEKHSNLHTEHTWCLTIFSVRLWLIFYLLTLTTSSLLTSRHTPAEIEIQKQTLQ